MGGQLYRQEGPGRLLRIGPSPSNLQRIREAGREVGGKGGGQSAAEAGEKHQQQRESQAKKPPGKREPTPGSQQQRHHSHEMGAQERAERPRWPRKRPAEDWSKRQGSAQKMNRDPAPGVNCVVVTYPTIYLCKMYFVKRQ